MPSAPPRRQAYRSLEEEAESKTRKLKQLWAKFRAAQSEIDDLQMEQQQEKQDLLHTVRELTRQVQLQNSSRRMPPFPASNTPRGTPSPRPALHMQTSALTWLPFSLCGVLS